MRSTPTWGWRQGPRSWCARTLVKWRGNRDGSGGDKGARKPGWWRKWRLRRPWRLRIFWWWDFQWTGLPGCEWLWSSMIRMGRSCNERRFLTKKKRVKGECGIGMGRKWRCRCISRSRIKKSGSRRASITTGTTKSWSISSTLIKVA